MIVWLIVFVAIAFVGFAAYVRIAPDDATRWHVDPQQVEERGKSNEFVVRLDRDGADMASPVYDRTPDALMDEVKRAMLAHPRTEILAESDGYVTFVQRSKLMAYPDYISVKAVPVEGGSALYVYSRSRYGHSDFGVNGERVSSLLSEL